jgi:hypothetical protein
MRNFSQGTGHNGPNLDWKQKKKYSYQSAISASINIPIALFEGK